MMIGNKTGVEKSLSRETISAPEVLDNPGGPEPTLLAQNALALVSMGQNTGGGNQFRRGGKSILRPQKREF